MVSRFKDGDAPASKAFYHPGALSLAGSVAMISDVREGVRFVVAMSALSLPRHDGDSAPIDGDGRARPALDLQEIGDRGHRDSPLFTRGLPTAAGES